MEECLILVYLYSERDILARISDTDRAKRLFEIDRLEQEGFTDNQISVELGLSLPVVKRAQKYLENLKKAEISPELLAEKRSELYLEYTEIAYEAKNQFELFKTPLVCKYCDGNGKVPKENNGVPVLNLDGDQELVVCAQCRGQGKFHYPKDANRFLITWAEILERKAKLFGLDNIKSENIINFNQFNSNQYVSDPMKISGDARKQADSLIKIIKENHEKNVRERNEEEI